ncbi:hypothetical protein GQ42DRAFT_167807 [Ramicandelaber brevisporus]|nr:hypothetical protein GQ42DRAFT_167807 [Ramicandelaber brevisporus]
MDGQRVVLSGWLGSVRARSSELTFAVVSDVSGEIQVIHQQQSSSDTKADLRSIPIESVVRIEGIVRKRPSDAVKYSNRPTDAIEVELEKVECINAVNATLPFVPSRRKQKLPSEETRLEHRYLDLRRPEMQQRLLLRAKAMRSVRQYLDDNGFTEIETPILSKSTPEGAREFLVPTRRFTESNDDGNSADDGEVQSIRMNNFYALAQSPQQFKQLLMAGGMDRYYQLAKCFRDEDKRADRQPEFTQIDLEMSFVTMSDVMVTVEGLVRHIWNDVQAFTKQPNAQSVMDTLPSLPDVIPRMTYSDAMARYGSDKPDTRFDLEIRQLNLPSTISSEHFVADVIRIPQETSKWTTNIRNGNDSSGISQLSHETVNELISTARKSTNMSENEAVFISVRDTRQVVGATAAGRLRLLVANELEKAGLLTVDKSRMDMLWVHDFPLFTNEVDLSNPWHSSISATHHPFTAPFPEDAHLMNTDPLKVRGQHYDLVLNGMEVGGGSIRIHDAQMQLQVFSDILRLEPDIVQRFDHMIQAFKHGCPPHGGIALGFDRLVSILAGGTASIRDVIAFPKAADGVDLLMKSPSTVTMEYLKEYRLVK